MARISSTRNSVSPKLEAERVVRLGASRVAANSRLVGQRDDAGRLDWAIDAELIAKPPLAVINGREFDVTAELEDGQAVSAHAVAPGLMMPPFLTLRLHVSGDVEGLEADG